MAGRCDWVAHVRKTQEKLNRRKKKNEARVGWRLAMQEASITWPKEKQKLDRKRKREAKKAASAGVAKKAKTEAEN